MLSSTLCTRSAYGGREKASDLLELELLRGHVGFWEPNPSPLQSMEDQRTISSTAGPAPV